MGRTISDQFMKELTNGKLNHFLKVVQNDDTLMLDLRGQSVTVYYRGGKIFSIKEKSRGLGGVYEFIPGDKKYRNYDSAPFKEIYLPSIENGIKKQELEEYIAKFKYNIDIYFGDKKVDKRYSIENEIRQHLVRENNNTNSAYQTDYFILDTEYQTPKGKKFDIIAIEWEATRESRSLKKYHPKLVVFELKYGNKALTGNSGIKSHLDDFDEFRKDENSVNEFREDMLKLLKQKRALGLIPYLKDTNKHQVELKNLDHKVEFVFLMANYNIRSTLFKEIVQELKDCQNRDDFQMITANHLGYGLFKNKRLNQEEVLKILSSQ